MSDAEDLDDEDLYPASGVVPATIADLTEPVDDLVAGLALDEQITAAEQAGDVGLSIALKVRKQRGDIDEPESPAPPVARRWEVVTPEPTV